MAAVSLLEVCGLSRSFYGVRALDGLDLRVEAGTVTGLKRARTSSVPRSSRERADLVLPNAEAMQLLQEFGPPLVETLPAKDADEATRVQPRIFAKASTAYSTIVGS